MSITEKTRISIGLLVTLAGGIGWLTNIHSASSANSESLKVLQTKVDSLTAIQTDIAVIKNKLENIESQLKKGK
jgi:hypothetical protein